MNTPLTPTSTSDQAREAPKSVAELLWQLSREARKTRFDVAPNPAVGAAVLSNGKIVGRGFHSFWGGPHAEVEALAEAKRSGVPKSEWETIVVTLEPCSSTGKTPPCAQAILNAGIGHVIVGALDPDPRHSGAGIELLRDAGVRVDFFGSRPEATDSWSLETTAPFFLDWLNYERLRRPRPWVIAKWAQTLTGQLSPPEDVGDGRWITGEVARSEVQVLRGRVDAILTGVGTVRADDPRLTVRKPGDTSRAPLRVVFDSYLSTPPDARLFAPLESSAAAAGDEAKGDVIIFAKSGPDPARYRALEEAGAHIVTLPGGDDGRISLRAAADWLWDAGVRRALLEAGPTLTQAFQEAELLDQARVYSGNVVGGRGDTLAPLVRTLVDRDRLKQSRLDRECGGDAVLEIFG